jgi:hypothetical protein
MLSGNKGQRESTGSHWNPTAPPHSTSYLASIDTLHIFLGRTWHHTSKAFFFLLSFDILNNANHPEISQEMCVDHHKMHLIHNASIHSSSYCCNMSFSPWSTSPFSLFPKCTLTCVAIPLWDGLLNSRLPRIWSTQSNVSPTQGAIPSLCLSVIPGAGSKLLTKQ